ncbi:hypothetical protein ATO8_03236 [Roseivivax marinus]|jgi:hypothetical protein|uniref:Uncharacterized protein n=1 Tax=Roseivivax marinus TaxID=1379903 RepID=W4HP47_9RHOB|nr:hypothetical protein [Roseivivax marinus]ETW13871.1 hypothetical protein ATO8_03236 [Roseivivax marinus]UMA63851.1 hypothetical protein LVO79_12525 [Roseivivax marinus]SEK87398.1 hypothetical protein SAMN05444413_10450 [Roseivivax marinus]
MNLNHRRPARQTADAFGAPVAVAVLSLVAFLALGRGGEGRPPEDILAGLLLVAAALSCRSAPLPNRAARIALALVMGLGLWMMLSGAVLAAAWVEPAGTLIAGGLDRLGGVLPEQYWTATGWGLLSLVSLPLTPRPERSA